MPKNHLGEQQFRTFRGWKKAILQIYPNVEFEGDKDIAQAKLGDKGVGEWDGGVGVIYKIKPPTRNAPRMEFVVYHGEEIFCFTGYGKKDAFNNAPKKVREKVKNFKFLIWLGDYENGVFFTDN